MSAPSEIAPRRSINTAERAALVTEKKTKTNKVDNFYGKVHVNLRGFGGLI